MSLSELQKKLDYQFKDKSLLIMAVTHKSFNNHENNERLEFIGDSVLNIVISEYLFNKFPNQKEGLLTRMRSHLVKGETLANLANNINLLDYIKLSKGTSNLSENRKYSILEGAIESLVGAVFLDSNFEQARLFVLEIMKKEIQDIDIQKEFRDSKTELQEHFQSQKIDLPNYQTISTSDGFECFTKYKNKEFSATGNSKRAAERAVARKVLDYIKS